MSLDAPPTGITEHVRHLWQCGEHITALGRLAELGLTWKECKALLLGTGRLEDAKIIIDNWTPPVSYRDPASILKAPDHLKLNTLVVSLLSQKQTPLAGTVANGWLSPKGVVHPCRSTQHALLLLKLGLHNDHIALADGWIKLHLSLIGGFVLFEGVPSAAQQTFIMQWHEVHNVSPDDYLANLHFWKNRSSFA